MTEVSPSFFRLPEITGSRSSYAVSFVGLGKSALAPLVSYVRAGARVLGVRAVLTQTFQKVLPVTIGASDS
jgi:hypothetical protein